MEKLSSIEIYSGYKESFTKEWEKQQKKSRFYQLVRLLIIIGIVTTLYFGWGKFCSVYGLVSAFFVGLFLFLVKKHEELKEKIATLKELISINEEEISFLRLGELHNPSGKEFESGKHDYSFDLDIFGPNSLFHFLNRTSCYKGGNTLAKFLSYRSSNSKIIGRQLAIKELAKKIVFRQRFWASIRLTPDNKSFYNSIKTWSQEDEKSTSSLWKIISYLGSAMILAMIVYLVVNPGSFNVMWIFYMMIFNCIPVILNFKKIGRELMGIEMVSKIIKVYSRSLSIIETEPFQSTYLINLKNEIKSDDYLSSEILLKFSSAYNALQSIQNVMGAFIMNGLWGYHIHAYFQVLDWKKKYAKYMMRWVDTIGHFEALNSLANFAYNNPMYAYPTLNASKEIIFRDMGHPLINVQERVDNNLELKKEKFIILTGSNMSGKSTFLRAAGVNMVLANCGAPVCASEADIHPMDVIVSMRLSDNLNEKESYFYAEVKRVQYIIDKCEKENCFVLIDEVFRGTNSDDKREGTVRIIKKMVELETLGILATHDLEVCNKAVDYGHFLKNECFEAQVIDKELYFDYKLRPGVCRNKNAIFLMDKMGI